MFLNVCDKTERHIGFICNIYPGNIDTNSTSHEQAYVVALTDFKLTYEHVNIDYVKDCLAHIFDSKNILGKVKDEKLKKAITDNICSENINLFNLDYEDMLMFAFLKYCPPLYNFVPSKFLNIDLNSLDINGYILLDIDKTEPYNTCLAINEEISTDPYEKLDNLPPLVMRVTDYPVMKTEIMGFGEGLLLGANLSDFGGRNHAHSTILTVKSGNCETTLELPIYLDTIRDSEINLYINDNKIFKILTNGRIYRY